MVIMDLNNPTYQSIQTENLVPQKPRSTGFAGFVKKHWFLLFLAVFATLLFILWIDGRNKSGQAENLSNLPLVTYPQISGQNINANVIVTFPAIRNLPTNVNLYQVKSKSLGREQAKVLASNLAFPKEPSNVSSEALLGEHYLWLSGAQTLSIRLSPLDLKMLPDVSEAPPPTGGTLPTQQAGSEFVNNVLSLNGLLSPGIDYTQVSSGPLLEGNVLQVGITPRIEGIDVVDKDLTSPLISGYLQKDGKLYGLIYRAGFENPTTPASYSAKTIKQIQDSLVSEGKIVALGDPEGEPAILVPTTISISKIVSSLLFTPEQPITLLPIYVLTGVATTETGEEPIYIYIPAVNSKYVRAL